MQERKPIDCPECGYFESDRRAFLRSMGVTVAGLTVGGSLVQADAPAKVASKVRPAEELVKEWFATFSEEQKKTVAMPWDHGSDGGKKLPTRLGMYNAKITKTIAEQYTKAQQELLQRIFKAMSSGDEGYRKFTRGGDFDNSKSFENIGAHLFGTPTDGQKWSLVFAGHHITVRCDGNSEDGAAFGGPMYYGHTPNGYSDKNVFNYQTKIVEKLYDALDEKQRKAATVSGSPGEQAASVKFKKPTDPKPGMLIGEMSRDQKELVEQVMRTLIDPFRKEDADEVMEIVKKNGGMEKIHFAFYPDKEMKDKEPWHFWRLEGPGFVWNFRVLPHVHTFVNISSKI